MADLAGQYAILELFESDDDENENAMLPPLHLLANGDDNYDVVRVLHPVLNEIQRIERVKIMKYIENIVHNYTDQDFIMHSRLSRGMVDELVLHFSTSEIYVALEGDAGNERLSAEKHVLTFLWFVGHQTASYRDVADRFGIALIVSTLFAVITRVTDFLLSIAPDIIRYPSQEERDITKAYYVRRKRFPGVIGAIDGCHIKIDKPLEVKDSYLNRKHYFSLHLQGE
ncbi:uncharacterized protein LOC111674210, partial [Orussus abietinus]|uniref:uncharacterized protein LOC111674210 n=1 Tax=Orussus abietinus TaxID=222816 RepID=UPI000C715AB1